MSGLAQDHDDSGRGIVGRDALDAAGPVAVDRRGLAADQAPGKVELLVQRFIARIAPMEIECSPPKRVTNFRLLK